MLMIKELVETNLSNNVIEFLKENYVTNLNIFGALDNSDKAKIYVDDINKPSGVLVNDGYFNYIYTESDEFIDVMLNQFFKEKGEYGFAGVERSLADKIIEKCELDWEEKSLVYYFPKETVDTSKIQTPVRSLCLEDSYVINEHYTYKDEDSIDRIRECIENRESVGVCVDDELVSWVMVHDDDSMGIMYTKKEYRKEGYAVDVTLHLVDKLLKKGKTPFLHIVEGNYASQGLASKCGFTKFGKCTWFGITSKS